MTKKIVLDPNNIPVSHVSGVVSNIHNNQTIMMNFVADRMSLFTDGSVEPDLIIAARLRFDLKTAQTIRDQLDAHLSGLTRTQLPDEKPN